MNHPFDGNGPQHHRVVSKGEDGTEHTIEMTGWMLSDGPHVIIAETVETGGNAAVAYGDGKFYRSATIEAAATYCGFDPAPVVERVRALLPRHPLATAAAREAAYEIAVGALKADGMIATSDQCRAELWHVLGALAAAGALREPDDLR